MGSKYRLRRVFRPVVMWIAKQFQKFNITPNQVSVVGTIIAFSGCAIFICFPQNSWGSLLFAILIFTAGLLDGVDGALARLTGTISVQGGYLDSVLDRYADAFIIVAFLGYYPTLPPFLGVPFLVWVTIALIGVIMVSYVRVRAELSGIPSCDVGLAGRSERLFIIFFFSLFNFLYLKSAYIGLIIVGILSHLTAIYRVFYTLRFKKQK